MSILNRFVEWLAVKNGTDSRCGSWERDIKSVIIFGFIIAMLLLPLGCHPT